MGIARDERARTMNEIKLLDHGHIRLVDVMGNDLSILHSARVSHNADWRPGKGPGSDERLLNYLWRNYHTTPFESVTLTLEVQAPILVFRQWHRHRTQSYNEMSARYTELPELFYVPDPELIGRQSATNKQGRAFDLNATEQQKRRQETHMVRAQNESAFALYRALLDSGWPKELARSHLPVSTYSRMFATLNLLNAFRFLTLRADPHAQYEIRVYAEAVIELLNQTERFPVALSAFKRWEPKMIDTYADLNTE